MRRRLLIAITALAAVAGVGVVSSAQATPFIGTYRGVDITFSVAGADGATYNIDITATQSVASTPSEQALYLDVVRCVRGRCRTLTHSRAPLGTGAVNIAADLASAGVATTVHGIRLAITAATQYIDVNSGSVEHPGLGLYSLGGPSLRTSADTSAPGTVTIGRNLRCPVIADIFSFQGIDTEDPSVRDPRSGPTLFPTSMLAGRHRASCAG